MCGFYIELNYVLPTIFIQQLLKTETMNRNTLHTIVYDDGETRTVISIV